MGVGCLLYCCLIKVLHATTRNGRQKWLNDTLSVWFLHGFVWGSDCVSGCLKTALRVKCAFLFFRLPLPCLLRQPEILF